MQNTAAAIALLTLLLLTLPNAACQSSATSADAMHASMAAERVESSSDHVAAAEIIEETIPEKSPTPDTPAPAKVPDALPDPKEVKVKPADPVKQPTIVPANLQAHLPQLVEITDTTFVTEISAAKGYALVDFNASWCAPCRRMTPIMESLAADDSVGAKIGKLDIMENPATSDQFNVYRIPCLILFKDGKEVDRREGARSMKEIKEWVQSMSAVADVKTTASTVKE